MKRSKLSESQIVAMLNEAEASVSATEHMRKYNVANSTFYKLKTKYAGMQLSNIRRLKVLEDVSALNLS